MIPNWEPYLDVYRNMRYQEDFPDAKYIPKRSTVIKNKKKNKRRKKK
jgi:hypothetical protein